MRCVDQQPSSKPEVRDETRKEQQGRDDASIITRPEEEQAGVKSVTNTGEAQGVSHVTREDTPQANSRSKKEHEDTSEDLGKVESILVDQQKHVRDLSSNRRKVVGVEVLLDNFRESTICVDQHAGDDCENNVGGGDGLLDNLESAESDSRSGVYSSTDKDKTQGDTDNNINDGNDDVEENTDFESRNVGCNFVSSFFGLLPFEKNPSDSNGGVDAAENGNNHQDTRRKGGSSEALSSLLQLVALIMVDGLGIRHLDELVRLFGRHCSEYSFVVGMLSDQ